MFATFFKLGEKAYQIVREGLSNNTLPGTRKRSIGDDEHDDKEEEIPMQPNRKKPKVQSPPEMLKDKQTQTKKDQLKNKETQTPTKENVCSLKECRVLLKRLDQVTLQKYGVTCK